MEAFIDKLGFAECVSTLTDDELRDDLLRYDDARLQLSDPRLDWDESMRILYFSDNVGPGLPVRFRAGDDSDGYHDGGGLGLVLGVVAAYQLHLALEGRFVRGGITRGPLYADNSFITGKDLVDATPAAGRGRPSRTSNWPRWAGCTGTTPADCTATSATSREFEAAFYDAYRTDQPLIGIQ